MLAFTMPLKLSIIGLLGTVIALVMARSFGERDVIRHIDRVVLGGQRGSNPRGAHASLTAAIRSIGSYIQGLSIFSARDIAELERTARSAGYNPETAVPLAIGGKLLLILLCPAIAYAVSRHMSSPWTFLIPSAGICLGLFGPNFAFNLARNARLKALRIGLSDALDLLVVCAEAGLGLESAIDRVAVELKVSNPQIAAEFLTLGQDLRLSSDRSAALLRMGERTGLETFHRLTVTLAQTLRYGTPLGQALRILAIEMRNDRLMRLEEKAARLPTLLMIPLAAFILPCLFIVVAGPAALRIMSYMM